MPTTTKTLGVGDNVPITRTTTGRIASIQTAGCTHAITVTCNGKRHHTTTHGEQPCPDRDTITGVLLIGQDNQRTWI